MCNLLKALQSELSFNSAFSFNDLTIWGRQIKEEWRRQNTEHIPIDSSGTNELARMILRQNLYLQGIINEQNKKIDMLIEQNRKLIEKNRKRDTQNGSNNHPGSNRPSGSNSPLGSNRPSGSNRPLGSNRPVLPVVLNSPSIPNTPSGFNRPVVSDRIIDSNQRFALQSYYDNFQTVSGEKVSECYERWLTRPELKSKIFCLKESEWYKLSATMNFIDTHVKKEHNLNHALQAYKTGDKRSLTLEINDIINIACSQFSTYFKKNQLPDPTIAAFIRAREKHNKENTAASSIKSPSILSYVIDGAVSLRNSISSNLSGKSESTSSKKPVVKKRKH